MHMVVKMSMKDYMMAPSVAQNRLAPWKSARQNRINLIVFLAI